MKRFYLCTEFQGDIIVAAESRFLDFHRVAEANGDIFSTDVRVDVWLSIIILHPECRHQLDVGISHWVN